jgi:hypothetical protein
MCVKGRGYRVRDLGLRVKGFRVWLKSFRMQSAGCGAYGVRIRV